MLRIQRWHRELSKRALFLTPTRVKTDIGEWVVHQEKHLDPQSNEGRYKQTEGLRKLPTPLPPQPVSSVPHSTGQAGTKESWECQWPTCGAGMCHWTGTKWPASRGLEKWPPKVRFKWESQLNLGGSCSSTKSLGDLSWQDETSSMGHAKRMSELY